MWKDLTMSERAALIKLGVDNGVTSLSDIRDSYNTYAEGGPIGYKKWKETLNNFWREDIDKHDYDYEKYYNDNPSEADRQLKSILNGGHGHFPDEGRSGTYKKPSHPTYPDLGKKSWSNNDTVFHLSERQAFGDTDRILDYLGSDLNYNNGATKVMYKDAYQLPSITVTPKGNYMDLVPNKLHTGWVYEDSPVRAFKDGGYKPSAKIKKRISTWEGSSMKTNRPFEAEAVDFNKALPYGATDKLSQEQLDGLYSYSYNVGAGNFRKRVSPVLQRYLAGQATIQDVQRSMWASKDSKLRGLANRRAVERNMFGTVGISDPSTNMMIANLPSENEVQVSTQEVPQLRFGNFTQPTSIDTYQSVKTPIEAEESTDNPLVGILNMLQSVKSNDYYTPNHYNVRI